MLMRADFYDIVKHICLPWLKIQINFTWGAGGRYECMFHYALVFGISSHNSTKLSRLFSVKTSKETEEQVTSGPILEWLNSVKLLLNLRQPWSDSLTWKGVALSQQFYSETWYAFPAMSVKLYHIQPVVTKGSFLSIISLTSAFIKQWANTDEVMQRLNYWISKCTHCFCWKTRKHNPNIIYYLHLQSRVFTILHTE